MSGTSRASAALATGTTTSRHPARAARQHRGEDAADRPDRPVEAQLADVDDVPDPLRRDHADGAATTATAIGRSKPLPFLGIDAGERLTVMRSCGQGPPELAAAALTRLGDWAQAVSGSRPA